MNKFVQHVRENHFIPNTVLVDCTADSYVASHYYDWLNRGIHVITPNKKANSGPLNQVICQYVPMVGMVGISIVVNFLQSFIMINGSFPLLVPSL